MSRRSRVLTTLLIVVVLVAVAGLLVHGVGRTPTVESGRSEASAAPWVSYLFTLLSALVSAVVGGLIVLAGQLWLRVLREYGDVRLKVYAWQVIYPEAFNQHGNPVRHPAVVGTGGYNTDPDQYQTVTASYSIVLELFNERDLETALLDVGVIFYKGDNADEVAAEGDLRNKDAPPRGRPIGERLYRDPPSSHEDLSRIRQAEELMDEPGTTLDLPSRRSTRITLIGEIEGKAGLEVMRSTRATLTATFPDGRAFIKEIGILQRSSPIYGEEWSLTVEEPRRRPWWRRVFGERS